jgi:phage protein U
MADVMMQLGLMPFSIDTAAYQRLSRTTEYRWTRQPLIGASDALQFVGYGPDTIEIEGVIHPQFKGGIIQVTLLRALADQRRPLPLVSGVGLYLGKWVIEAVTEGQAVFARRGVPQRQEFSMRLGKFDG